MLKSTAVCFSKLTSRINVAYEMEGFYAKMYSTLNVTENP